MRFDKSAQSHLSWIAHSSFAVLLVLQHVFGLLQKLQFSQGFFECVGDPYQLPFANRSKVLAHSYGHFQRLEIHRFRIRPLLDGHHQF